MANQRMIYYIAVLKNDRPPPETLVVEEDLKSFGRFTQGSARQLIEFGIKTLAERIKPGMREQVEQGTNMKISMYSHTRGVCGAIVTDQGFKNRNAQACLNKLLDEFLVKNPDLTVGRFESPPLGKYIQEWRNEDNVDKFAAVQRELDETTVVLHKTIESVLERGEKLDDLVAKSDNLNYQAKMFYSTAKKQNSCCVVM